MGRKSLAAVVMLSGVVAGCGGGGQTELTSSSFYGASHHATGETPLSSNDNSGQIPVKGTPDQPTMTNPPGGSTPTASGDSPSGPASSPGDVQPAGPISPTVDKLVRPPGSDAATQPEVLNANHQPATNPTDLATTQTSDATTAPSSSTADGEYLTLGGVVAIVNTHPIYANKVLRLDAEILREKAQEMDLAHFSLACRAQIEKTTNELIRNELEYAAADRSLEQSDKTLAHMITTKWREQQIASAGGSKELAQRKSAQEGKSFEDDENDQFRLYMVKLYYTRKVEPKVQVSRSDMYDYYQAHLDTEYTRHDVAQIQYLRADPNALDRDDSAHGNELAIDALANIRKRVLAGDDLKNFAQNAGMSFREMTDEKGSLAAKNVEKAIWSLSPGQISDVIPDTNGVYLVKVLSRETGGVKQFEDQQVQGSINNILRAQQMYKLREQVQQKLMEDAIIVTNNEMIDACVEMAMQNYKQWSGAK